MAQRDRCRAGWGRAEEPARVPAAPPPCPPARARAGTLAPALGRPGPFPERIRLRGRRNAGHGGTAATVPSALHRRPAHLGLCHLPCQQRQIPRQLPAYRPALRLTRRSARLCLRSLPQRPHRLDRTTLHELTRSSTSSVSLLSYGMSGWEAGVWWVPSLLPDRTVVVGSQKKRPVKLTAQDREELVRVTTTGVRGASMIMRARVLLALDISVGEVDSKEVIAARLGVSGETLRLVVQRFR